MRKLHVPDCARNVTTGSVLRTPVPIVYAVALMEFGSPLLLESGNKDEVVQIGLPSNRIDIDSLISVKERI